MSTGMDIYGPRCEETCLLGLGTTKGQTSEYKGLIDIRNLSKDAFTGYHCFFLL